MIQHQLVLSKSNLCCLKSVENSIFLEEFLRSIWKVPSGTILQAKLSVRPNEDITSFV